MKPTKDTKNAKVWALYFDGKSATITNNPEQYKDFKGVIIPISADTAATALALMLEQKEG